MAVGGENGIRFFGHWKEGMAVSFFLLLCSQMLQGKGNKGLINNSVSSLVYKCAIDWDISAKNIPISLQRVLSSHIFLALCLKKIRKSDLSSAALPLAEKVWTWALLTLSLNSVCWWWVGASGPKGLVHMTFAIFFIFYTLPLVSTISTQPSNLWSDCCHPPSPPQSRRHMYKTPSVKLAAALRAINHFSRARQKRQHSSPSSLPS